MRQVHPAVWRPLKAILLHVMSFEGVGLENSANIPSTFAFTEVTQYLAVNLISVYSPTHGMGLPLHPENGL